MNNDTYVGGYGPKPCQWAIVGQSPGADEVKAGRPFVGKSGAEQATYLRRHGLDVKDFYLTNVIKEFVPPKATPTQAQVDRWRGELARELDEVSPSFIIAVGAFATRAFLGPCDLESCHGIPHRLGAFDNSITASPDMIGAWGACVVPCYHPAAGMYDAEIRALCNYDYGQAARWIRVINEHGSHHVEYREDEYEGHEHYVDVDGEALAAIVDALADDVYIGYDTEGVLGAEWSLQVSTEPATGYVLRRSRDDFAVGAAAVQRVANRGVTFVAHNLMHDMSVSRALGVELSRARLLDTMYMAYALKLEPQSLKALSWRWLGRRRKSYRDVVGDAGTRKQVAYLAAVMSRRWPVVEARVELGNDGELSVYKPQGAARRALSILADHADALDAPPVLDADSGDDDAGTVDLLVRWRQVDPTLRRVVERELGPMPVGTLDDLPLDEAVNYAAADADDELRLYPKLRAELEAQGLWRVVERGMASLPAFERIQATGMPASRRALLSFRDDIRDRKQVLQAHISRTYCNGEAFNPASRPQVAALLKRRGLKPAKLTKTGTTSTAKGSIEHLRFVDAAVADVIAWRELDKMQMFGDAADLMDDSDGANDIQWIRGQVKLTRIPTRRIAMSEPNLLQIPTRHELGKTLKSCYVAPTGYDLGSWDLSGIEMRVAAHLANDEFMCRLFNEGRDVHSEVAAMIFGLALVDDADPKVRYQNVDEKRHRYPAKRAGFGSLYGIGGEGLYTQLRQMPGCDGWDAKSCEKLIRDWFGVYKGIKREIDATAKWVRERGYVEEPLTLARRYLPGVWSDDKHVRGEAERQAFNHRVQGMAQTMLQEAMIYLWTTALRPVEDVCGVEWCLQQHDELIFAFTEGMFPVLDEIVVDALVNHCGVNGGLRVPVKASGHAAKLWSQLK